MSYAYDCIKVFLGEDAEWVPGDKCLSCSEECGEVFGDKF